jgi:DNA polymerase III subunit epsilon
MQPLVVCTMCKKIKVKFDEINSSSFCEECFKSFSKTKVADVTTISDFITIDFEIANNKMSSACSMGMAFVKDHQVVDEKYFLIQPSKLEIDAATTKIHGITVEDVKNAHRFDEIWEEIKHYFNGTTIIAHNAQFDMSVLHSCLTEYSLVLPKFNYICSIPLSSAAIRGKSVVGNSLKERLAYFNIELTNHHHAGSDARACAELVIASMKMMKKASLQTYISQFGERIFVRDFSDLKPQAYFKNNKFNNKKVVISDISVTVDTISTNNPFFGKNVVFTGELGLIERKEAMQKVVNYGGFLKSGVSSKTDYLVVGIQDKSLVGDEGLSTKEKKANELIEKGKNIRLVNEKEFIKLLNPVIS